MPDDHGSGRTCPWCSAAAPETASQCPSCGAALAQRESIGDLAIPGVTTIDPALQAIDGQPIRLRGPSPSQSVASGMVAAAVLPGPLALAALGGLAAVGAAEYLGAGHHGRDRPATADIGQPSEVTLRALERLEGGTTDPDADETAGGQERSVADAVDPWQDQPAVPATDPWRDLPAGPASDPWRDLPADAEGDQA